MSPLVVIALILGVQSDGPPVELDGYAEYRHGPILIVEGRKVVADEKTRFEGRNIRDLASIPLGYEVEVDGYWSNGGFVVARIIEAKPNGMAMFEAEVLEATNAIEKMWVDAGAVYDEDSRGRKKIIGKILEDGPEVERVRRIMAEIRPPYLKPDDLRVRVVDTKEWNASAMGNGAIWVYTGLIREMSDDELAIILGHELAHYTHEHSRRGAKQQMWGQIAGIAAAIGAGSVNEGAGRRAASMGAMLSLTAFQSGYSRDLEDQSDRVGLRYAYEGGFDVSRGPGLWNKFRKKYGESGSLENFFFGSHSRPSDRIRNIERELRLNYSSE